MVFISLRRKHRTILWNYLEQKNKLFPTDFAKFPTYIPCFRHNIKQDVAGEQIILQEKHYKTM